jgi:hypothetical protein
MLTAIDDELLIAKDTELEFNPCTEKEWAEDCATLRKRAETPYTREEWDWRFNFLANIRLQILENERLTIDELAELIEDQLDEVEVWWRGLNPERRRLEAAWVEELFRLGEEIEERIKAKVRAYALKAYGVAG